MVKRILLLLATLAIVVSVSACDSGGDQKPHVSLAEDDVDQRFREFYDLLGGAEVLGVPISPKFSHGEYEYQYTAAALMVYSPNAVASQRYQLAALGVELGVAEPPMNPDAPKGYDIYEGFMDLYTMLGGARFVGLPLTDVRYNAEKNRIEQYFENLGFYQLESEPVGKAHLLSYGAWKCADVCGYDPPEGSEVGLISSAGSPFSEAIQRLDPSFTGFPLTEPYTSFDGMLEQIFENVVVVAEPNNPGGIKLRPILGMLSIPVGDGGNYAVPDVFLEYINRNSGLEFSGNPVSEYTSLSENVFRQCFTNLCLDYYPNAPEGLRVRPAPLGNMYKNLYYQPGNDDSGPEPLREVTLHVWERYPLLADGQIQEIGVSIADGTTPLKTFEPVLTLTVPGSGDISYTFPPTRDDGTTYLELNPISAPNGTRIQYQVCVTSLKNERFCVQDDFMIWGNP